MTLKSLFTALVITLAVTWTSNSAQAVTCVKCKDAAGNVIWTTATPAMTWAYQAGVTACNGAGAGGATYTGIFYTKSPTMACGTACSNPDSDPSCVPGTGAQWRCNTGDVVDGIDACMMSADMNCQWNYIGSCCLINGTSTCTASPVFPRATCGTAKTCNWLQKRIAIVPPDQQDEYVASMLVIFALGLLLGIAALLWMSRRKRQLDQNQEGEE